METLAAPLFAIVLALTTKRVFIALLGGILLGELIVNGYVVTDAFESLMLRTQAILAKAWVLKTLAFALLVGAVITLLTHSRAVGSLIDTLINRRKIVTSARGAQLFTYGIGVLIFIESSITSLIAGAVGRELFDRYGISRAKLAYICDATSAPICSLIALNGWGALISGLIVSAGVGDANGVFLHSLACNFYAMSALLVALLSIMLDIDTPAMRNAQKREYHGARGVAGVALYYLTVPFGVMMGTLFVTLYITGEGNIVKGSGSSAIFYATLFTVMTMLLLYRAIPLKERIESVFSGIKSMVPITLILLLAFLIGDVTKSLHAGEYLASFAKAGIDARYLPALIFLLAAVMGFSTGTSWGTFSIMIPIAVALAHSLGIDVALAVGAVISGGVFGDHCSPISDTTIISSLAAGCDHVTHVNTQLPYALFSAFLALLLFLLFGAYYG